MNQYYPKFQNTTVSIDANHNMIFNYLRREEKGVDFEIQITENETVTVFKVHSQVLLMSSSEFFKTLFSDRWNVDKEQEVAAVNSNSSDLPLEASPKQLKVVKIGAEHANPETFKEILDFLYTGSIVLRPANIRSVLETAHYLQLAHLLDHAQVYFERMLAQTPEVSTYQIYNHIAVLHQTGKVPNLSRFGKKLYAFQNVSGYLMIVVKSIPDNRWIFADSVELEQTENLFEKSDVYLGNKNYIILHQTPTGSLNSLAVTPGVLYYSGPIDEKVYLCGSEPLGGQCFDKTTQKFSGFPLPARGVNKFANLVWENKKMILVADNEYLSIAEPNISKEWKEYKIPQACMKAVLCNIPIIRIQCYNNDQGEVLFFSPSECVRNAERSKCLSFYTKSRVFNMPYDDDELDENSHS